MGAKQNSARRADEYVHGYSEREDQRLRDQAQTLAELLHQDTFYPVGSRVLEAGCGVGAQTVILAKNSPGARFTSVDISPVSVKAAEAAVRRAGFSNVAFQPANIFKLPFPKASFDHVFACFVLEHLKEPARALRCLKAVLKPGGTLTVIEGDHGSTLFHPRSDAAWKTIQCLIDLQAEAGGDALIGRRLFPLVRAAGFRKVTVSPRFVYVDASRPSWVEGFTRNTYIAMVEGVRDRALAAGLIGRRAWEKGISDLKESAGSSGVFCYTFFKAVAVKS
ncbi:MAG: methyltransferase domain-containing protein [Verrucomicrobiota bacterium]|jgi:ubiquinone/menaquinone biosynthesis C-methylase UbiE